MREVPTSLNVKVSDSSIIRSRDTTSGVDRNFCYLLSKLLQNSSGFGDFISDLLLSRSGAYHTFVETLLHYINTT